MIPQKNETTTLFTLTTRNKAWVVKGEVVTLIDDVVVIDNSRVRLVATVHGRQFYCERVFNPVTLEELRDAVWKPVVSGRARPCPDHLLVEAVVAFNVHRVLGKKSDEFVCNRTLGERTGIVPHAHNAYCATHDRAHYWSQKCPVCESGPVPQRAELQAA